MTYQQEAPEALDTLREPLLVTFMTCPDGQAHSWRGPWVLITAHDGQELCTLTCTTCGLPRYDYDFYVP